MMNSINKPLHCTILMLALSTPLIINTAIAASNELNPSNEVTQLNQGEKTVSPIVEDSTLVDNNIKNQLIDKLVKISFFSAKFTQQVVDEQGQVLQNGSGEISVSKPNLVHWQTLLPDETLLVSDGEVLWAYDPFIEQVIAYTLNNVIANTPILLLTSNDASLWDNFTVSKVNNETFIVLAKDANSQVKKLELSFDKETSELTRFTILDATGQLSIISLKDVDYINVPDSTLFKFTLPNGVYLDDQR